MGNLGARLQQAREQAGISLEHLSKRTKIRKVLLTAIEREDFGSLPSGILARGFLRAYAHEVGIDSDAVVRQYEDEFGSPSLSDSAPALFVSESIAHEHGSGRLLITVAIVVALMTGIFAGVFIYFAIIRM